MLSRLGRFAACCRRRRGPAPAPPGRSPCLERGWPGDLAHIEGHEKAPLIVGDAGEAIAAAAAGLGRARVPALLAQSWIDDGRVKAEGPIEEGRRGYWLVAPLPQWRQKKVKALVAFLAGE